MVDQKTSEEILYFKILHREKVMPDDVKNFLPSGTVWSDGTTDLDVLNTSNLVIHPYTALNQFKTAHYQFYLEDADELNIFIAQDLDMSCPTIYGLEVKFHVGSPRCYTRWIYSGGQSEAQLIRNLSNLPKSSIDHLKKIIELKGLKVDWLSFIN